MGKFQGEEKAVKQGLVDKVFFLSEYQAESFRELYKGVPEAIIDNYVEPSRFPFAVRRNAGIVLGRLSRPDPVKFSEDFPVFYEALELPEARYRVMAWSRSLHEKYAWHRFGSEWELLGSGAVAAADFLRSLDLFVYSFGPFFRESWGRAVVEAMLTGAIPLVPAGCHFGYLAEEGKSGYLCGSFAAYQEAAQRLYWDFDLRRRMSERCARYAREKLCDRAAHRAMWAKALETARKVGVHREFCVFSDRQVIGAICYEAGGVKAPEDRRFWVYLSAGVKKFAFDYAVWVSPGTVFRRVPGAVLRVLKGAPVHVPLVRKLDALRTDREKQLCAVYRDGGARGGLVGG